MEENPVCALTFFWPSLERQLRIEGTVARVPEQQSEAYFKSRPRGAQIGAWCSPQSSPVANRQVLEDRYTQLEKKFSEGDIPKPKQWGGYAVDPFFFEFWQGRPNRVHDRIVYLRSDNTWKISRLAP
jgi:pyridoxamine 5'-phosphate oxidase